MQNIKIDISDRDPNNVLFFSDLHLGHDREFMWGPRSFSSSAEHDKFVKDNWDVNVKDDTLLFDIGDTTFNDANCKRFTDYSTWKGERYLLWGNHRSGARQVHRKACTDQFGHTTREIYPITFNNVTFVGGSVFLKWKGKQFLYLAHFPHAIWDGCSGNSRLSPVIHLCGHSHGTFPKTQVENRVGKILDVGVDNALKHNGSIFFSLAEVLDIMETKEIETLDHHKQSVNYGL